MVYTLVTLSGVLLGLASYRVGLGHSYRRTVQDVLTERGLTRRAAKLYDEAASLLNGLVRLTDLDGDFGETRLAPAKQEEIERWLDRYRRERGLQ